MRPMWPRGAPAWVSVAALVAGVGSAGARAVVVVMTGSDRGQGGVVVATVAWRTGSAA